MSILFGLWMKQPAIESPLSVENAKLNEQFVSIFWNLMAALAQAPGDEPKTRVCMERLCFKFVENRVDKLSKLAHLHQALYERIADFDLAEFT